MKVFILSKRKLIFCLITLFMIPIIASICVDSYYTIDTNNNLAKTEFNKKVENLCKAKEKVAYLTFDDGPNKVVTPKILDILKSQNIKATFFVIGKKAEEYPEIIKREYEEGHYIANHTYSHNNKQIYKTEESFINEIKKTDIAIGKAIGNENYSSNLFRFPNGYASPVCKMKKKNMLNVLLNIDYTYIDWNCLNNDSTKKYTKVQLLENLKKSSKGKDTLVILMHDTKDVSDSSEALADSIEFLKTEGYIFENFYNLQTPVI